MNSVYTIEYSQPSEYRFSQDSVETPRAVGAWANARGLRSPRVLDLCAGTGVMGLEFAFHFRGFLQVDFVEIQSIYREHFDINSARLSQAKALRGEELRARWLERDYGSMLSAEFADSYDLVLANPPYFRRDQGPLGPSEFKNRCRFFLDNTPESLWDVCAHVLKPNASAFVLVRSLANHGQDVVGEISRRLRYSAQVEIFEKIRTAELLKITKTA